jgi:hypothetical protein
MEGRVMSLVDNFNFFNFNFFNVIFFPLLFFFNFF